MFVGLLMVNQENDILERTLENHLGICDVIYVLDGTVPNTESHRILVNAGCRYFTDHDLPRPPYPEGTVCGYRGFIYDKAVEDLGWDHWFLELHGDEVWTFHPSEAIAANPGADGFIFPLPFYFPREPWQDDVHALDQLRWHYKPGWPEFRMFHGNPAVQFGPTQHFNTQPVGLERVVSDSHAIRHYPYRSPQVQRSRAALHQKTGFDPDNYRHIIEGDNVIWTDEMMHSAACEYHHEISCDL